MTSIKSLFTSNNKNGINKWSHYFDIYDRYLFKYKGKDVTILEIGIFQGGSLQLWRDFFGPNSRVIGVDINPDCLQFADDRINIFIGSQSDREFWSKLKSEIGKIDILIDDGGHTMDQQLVTFEEMFDHISMDGIYICEDTHTSYWMGYRGGLRRPGTFIEKMKDIVDQLTLWHYGTPTKFTKNIRSVSFFDSLVIIEKGEISRPVLLESGKNNSIENLVKEHSHWSSRLYYLQTIIKRILHSFSK